MFEVKTKFTPANFEVTDLDRRQAFWLIQKRTSIAYITRVYEIYTVFVKGYEMFVSKVGATPKRRSALAGLFEYLSQFEEGLERLRKGDLLGYHVIYSALGFNDFLQDREFENGYYFVEIGYRDLPKQHVALYRFADKAMVLGRQIGFSLGYSRFPLVTKGEPPTDYIPKHLPPLPKPQGPILKYWDDQFPVSGIYIPLHPFGCPTYFPKGTSVLKATVPISTHTEWETRQDWLDGKSPTFNETFFDDVNANWMLLWKDDRYQNGRIPDESEYIDPSMDMPTDPLMPQPTKEEDYF